MGNGYAATETVVHEVIPRAHALAPKGAPQEAEQQQVHSAFDEPEVAGSDAAEL